MSWIRGRARAERRARHGDVTTLPAHEEVATEVGPLLVSANDSVILPILRETHAWEPDEALLFRSMLGRGDCVVDIGAHVGYYTVLSARAVGRRGHVFAIEASPVNAALLRTNVVRNGLRNVTVLEGAAWRTTTNMYLRVNRDNTGDHRVTDEQPREEHVVIRAMSLDAELPSSTRVDFVKIDAQGTDHFAVEGMEQIVRRDRPTIFVEFWPEGIRSTGSDPTSVIDYYRTLDFRLSIPGIQGSFDNWPANDFVDLAERLPGGFSTLILRPPP